MLVLPSVCWYMGGCGATFEVVAVAAVYSSNSSSLRSAPVSSSPNSDLTIRTVRKSSNEECGLVFGSKP